MAADGRPYDLLAGEYPDLEIIRLQGYNISYPRNSNMVLKMSLQIPKILQGIKQEHRELDTRLAGLCRRRFLKSGEELETRRLKKRKLILKDRMAAIAQEYSNSERDPSA